MSNIKTLRSLVNRRLNAAVNEAFELFERTIAEYEEQLRASKEENQRQQKLLDAVFSPVVRIQRAELHQVAVMKKEEHHERSLEITEPPPIKEEREDFFVDQERAPLQGAEEMDINVITVIPVSLKSEEEDGQAPQTSQLHESQSEENRYMEFVKTEDDEEDCGGLDDEEDCGGLDDKEDCGGLQDGDFISYIHSPPDKPEGFGPLLRDVKHQSRKKSVGASGSAKPSKKQKQPLKNDHLKKPYLCLVCGKRFPRRLNYRRHMERHEKKKTFHCSICKKSFFKRSEMMKHMNRNAETKPFQCDVCCRRFTEQSGLDTHSVSHTRVNPFECAVCHKRFERRHRLKEHSAVHIVKEPFSCSICGQVFVSAPALRKHALTHTGRPFDCLYCGKKFAHPKILLQHACTHKREKSLKCADCGKHYTNYKALREHIRSHKPEKPFSCSICGDSFDQTSDLERHLKTHKHRLHLQGEKKKKARK